MTERNTMATQQPLTAVIVGTGFGGIGMAIKLRQCDMRRPDQRLEEVAKLVVGAIQPEPDRGNVPGLISLTQLLHHRSLAETRRRAD